MRREPSQRSCVIYEAGFLPSILSIFSLERIVAFQNPIIVPDWRGTLGPINIRLKVHLNLVTTWVFSQAVLGALVMCNAWMEHQLHSTYPLAAHVNRTKEPLANCPSYAKCVFL